MYHKPTSTRLLYVLFASQSLLSAAQIAMFTLIAIMAVELSGTESTAGLPSSAQTFTQALTALPIAMVMGRFGRRFGLTIAYTLGVLGGVVGLIAVLQGMFPLLLLSAMLMGMSRAGGDQSRFAAGEIFPRDMRARMIGRVIFAGTIGAIAGPALVAPVGRLMESIGLPADSGPWVAGAVLCAVAALITLLLLRPEPMHIARAISDEEENAESDFPRRPARRLSHLLLLPSVQLAMLAMLISQTVMVVLMVMTPLHMDHQHHSREAISMVIAAHTLGMFGLSAVTGYLIDRFGRIPMLILGALTLIVSAVMAPAAQGEFMLALALFLLGLGWNFGYVAGSSLLADALQGAERARVQGINDSLVAFSAGIMSLSAGPLFATGGYRAVSTVGIALTLVLILVTYLMRPRLEAATA